MPCYLSFVRSHLYLIIDVGCVSPVWVGWCSSPLSSHECSVRPSLPPSLPPVHPFCSLKAFQPKSTFELLLLLFLVIWWTAGVIIETTVRGIAGDGKGVSTTKVDRFHTRIATSPTQ